MRSCGDCKESDSSEEEFDNEISEVGISEVRKLNEKYGVGSETVSKELPKFHFLYRKRTWNPSEKCYLGWERKRGLICEFNQFLVEGINPFKINTIPKEFVRQS